jgi:hypothetical protein
MIQQFMLDYLNYSCYYLSSSRGVQAKQEVNSMQPEQRNPTQVSPREAKITALCEMIRQSSEEQTDLDKLVALGMRTGYELGKQSNS